jgi:hypothetical protein
LEADGAAIRFISGGTLYRLAVDDEVPVQTLLEQEDPRWFGYLAQLESGRLAATREQGSTRIAAYAPPENLDGAAAQPIIREETTNVVPGRVISIKERSHGYAAPLSTLKAQDGGGATLFYRVTLDSSGHPIATEIAAAQGALIAIGKDLFTSQEGIIRLDFDSGTLETVLHAR